MSKFLSATLAVTVAGFLSSYCADAQTCPPEMVPYWRFDGGGGTAATDSVGTNHGTLINGPTRTTGRVEGGLSFDGADDYVRIAAAADLDTKTALTWEAWIYPRGNDAPNAILEANSGSYYGAHMFAFTGTATSIQCSGNNFLFVNLFDTDGGRHIFCSGHDTIALNAWNHVAVTYDGTIARMYVNGDEMNSLSLTANIQTSY